MSKIKFNTIENEAGTYSINIDDIQVSNVVQTHLTSPSTQSLTAGVTANILDLNATITPSAADKRIKVTVKWSGEFGVVNAQDIVFGLNRDGVSVGSPAAVGSRALGISGIAYGYYDANATSTMDSTSFTYIDSPASTDPIIYSAIIRANNSSTLYNQRTVTDSDTSAYERLTSTITLEEVGP